MYQKFLEFYSSQRKELFKREDLSKYNTFQVGAGIYPKNETNLSSFSYVMWAGAHNPEKGEGNDDLLELCETPPIEVSLEDFLELLNKVSIIFKNCEPRLTFAQVLYYDIDTEEIDTVKYVIDKQSQDGEWIDGVGFSIVEKI